MNGYTYKVLVSGICSPAVTSTTVMLTAIAAPVITSPPAAVTLCAGANATFTVTATGNALTYQWQENAGLGFVDIAGATGTSYTKYLTTSAMNGYQYRVVVSGTCAPAATSPAVLLTVNTAPTITAQPLPATVCAGANATFGATATGTGLAYQWQEDAGSGFVNLAGATNASLTRTAVTAGMNGYQYRVIVSGICTPPVTSNGVALTVNTAPVITTQPAAITVCAGTDASFTASASGTGLMYQWQENTGSGFVDIAGATGASFTKTGTTGAMSGYQYQVTITGACTPPVTSNAVALTVNTAPVISSQPMSITVVEMNAATFSITATGTGLTYQWQENTGSGFINISGATSSTYIKMATTLVMSGYQYRVIINGTCTLSLTSTAATLTVATGALAVAPKAYLGGAYDLTTHKMRDELRTRNLLPNAQPYNGALYGDFAYAGTETIGAGVLAVTGDNAIVDWVLVELHDAANPITVVARKAALIQRDGDVVNATDGTSPVMFAGVVPGNYYVSVRHRNHLGVMTASTLALSNVVTSVNFTTTATGNYQLSGANGSAYAQQLMDDGKRALWPGNMSNVDNTGNRIIYQGNDADTDEPYFRVLSDPNNGDVLPVFVVTAYDRADSNLDGDVIYQGGDSDVDQPFFTVFLFPGNSLGLPTYIIFEQIPH